MELDKKPKSVVKDGLKVKKNDTLKFKLSLQKDDFEEYFRLETVASFDDFKKLMLEVFRDVEFHEKLDSLVADTFGNGSVWDLGDYRWEVFATAKYSDEVVLKLVKAFSVRKVGDNLSITDKEDIAYAGDDVGNTIDYFFANITGCKESIVDITISKELSHCENGDIIRETIVDWCYFAEINKVFVEVVKNRTFVELVVDQQKKNGITVDNLQILDG